MTTDSQNCDRHDKSDELDTGCHSPAPRDEREDKQHNQRGCRSGLLFGFTIAPAQLHQAKPNDKSPFSDNFIEPERVLGPCPFSFSTVQLLCATWQPASLGERFHADKK